MGRYKRREAFCNFVIKSQLAYVLGLWYSCFLDTFPFLNSTRGLQGAGMKKKKKKRIPFLPVGWGSDKVFSLKNNSLSWRTLCIYYTSVTQTCWVTRRSSDLQCENLIGSQGVKPMKKMWGFPETVIPRNLLFSYLSTLSLQQFVKILFQWLLLPGEKSQL